MLTSRTVAFLRSAEGEAALRAASELELKGAAFLRELTRLRRLLAAERAVAVLEQTLLRRRAAAKFSRATEMLFTQEGLEQASGERVAAHSAARYAGYSRIADLCCGIGGDTIALARHGQVEAYDHDPIRLACAEHNAAVHGLSDRIRFHLADVEALGAEAPVSRASVLAADHGPRTAAEGASPLSPLSSVLSPVEAIFYDPGRRVEGRRVFSLAGYRPPVSLVERWIEAVPAIGVKVAPGVAHEEIVWECEREFVAEGNDLKEGLLWFGPLATAARRASLLPSGATLVSADGPRPALSEPLAWLYDPSPAVTRASIVWELAALLGARQLDPELAYLTAAERRDTPFARLYGVEEWLPFNLKRLKARLRELDAGHVTVRKRGSPIDPAIIERRLRQEGTGTRTVILTKLRGTPIAIVCRQIE